MWRRVCPAVAALVFLGTGVAFGLGLFPSGGLDLPGDFAPYGVPWTSDGEGLLLLGAGPGGDGIMELRSLTGRQVWRAGGFVLPAPLWRCAAFSPDGETVAVGDMEGLHLLIPETGEGSALIPVDGDIARLWYVANGRLVVAVVQEDVLYLEWRDGGGALLSREEIAPWAAPAYALATRLSLTPEGRFLLYPGGEPDLWHGFWVVNLLDREAGETRTWDLREPLPWLQEAGYIEALALRPDGEEIAVALTLRETGHPVLLRLDAASGEVAQVPLGAVGRKKVAIDLRLYELVHQLAI